jgi:hypothetical protein
MRMLDLSNKQGYNHATNAARFPIFRMMLKRISAKTFDMGDLAATIGTVLAARRADR